MAETTATSPASGQGFDLRSFVMKGMRGDVALAVGIMGILVIGAFAFGFDLLLRHLDHLLDPDLLLARSEDDRRGVQPRQFFFNVLLVFIQSSRASMSSAADVGPSPAR